MSIVRPVIFLPEIMKDDVISAAPGERTTKPREEFHDKTQLHAGTILDTSPTRDGRMPAIAPLPGVWRAGVPVPAAVLRRADPDGGRPEPPGTVCRQQEQAPQPLPARLGRSLR